MSDQQRPINILVIDDERILADLIVEQIEKIYNATATACYTPTKAISLIHEQAFDIVLVDEHMPVMRGSELVRFCKDRAKTFVIMSGALTARSNKDLFENLQVLFIAKPFSIKQLKTFLAGILIEKAQG